MVVIRPQLSVVVQAELGTVHGPVEGREVFDDPHLVLDLPATTFAPDGDCESHDEGFAVSKHRPQLTVGDVRALEQ